MRVVTKAGAVAVMAMTLVGMCGTAWAQGKGGAPKEQTNYPVSIQFTDGADKIQSDGGTYAATIFTGNGTASFDMTNTGRSVKLLFDNRVDTDGLTSAPSGLLSASGSVGLIDLGQVGSAPTARYVRITLVGTAFKNDVLAFRRVTMGSSPTVIDGTPVCAVKTAPGVWRVSTLPTIDPVFGGCQSINAEMPGEIGGVSRSVKNSTVKVANYRMPFSLTVTLDCALVPSTATGAAASWCQY